MKFLVAFLMLMGVILVGCDLEAKDVELNENSTIPKGEGQFCEGDFDYGPCLDGLVCINVSTSPYVIAKCYPQWAVEEEGFTPERYDLLKEIEAIEENARNRE